MKKTLVFLMTLGLVALLVGAGFAAYFSDTETSSNNSFTAGTLDLQVDGENPLASAKFTITNFRPENQPKGTFNLQNAGTVNGYIDLESITVTNYENVCVEPETEAGDTTCGDPGLGKGELQDVVNLRLFVDSNCDGWISTGENVFYNGLVNGLAGNYELDEPLNAGGTLCIGAIFDWWNTPNDNLAQSDSMVLDLTFELGQDASQ